MAWPTIFANLAAGNQPLALFDSMFNQVAAMIAIPCSASGSNTITLTPLTNAPTLAAYADFNIFSFRAAANSTGAVSLSFSGLASLPCYKADASTPVGNGDLVSGQNYLAFYSSSLNAGGGGFLVQPCGFVAASATFGGIFVPGGRVTLVTNTPVMTASATAIGQHYYTPYTSQWVPLYNGSTLVMTDIGGQLTQTAADATKSPAAVANNSVYYLFVWNDGGTFRCTRGPAWTNDTTPGAGNALVLQNGVYLNSASITNGPSASRGTLVGAVRSNGSATFDWVFGTLAANGGAALLNVSNIYNRIRVSTFVQDTTDSWTYTTATWRAANGSNTMRVSFLQALNQDSIEAKYQVESFTTVNDNTLFRSCGIGYDVTNALASGCSPGLTNIAQIRTGDGLSSASAMQTMMAQFVKPNDLGAHFVQAIEISAATGTTTWRGDGGTPTTQQNGLFYSGFH